MHKVIAIAEKMSEVIGYLLFLTVKHIKENNFV